MFGTIRKHSGWLWIVIAGLTIVSFVVFMGSGPARNGGGHSAGYGTIYGHTITAAEYTQAQRAFFISYWQQTGEWPNRSRNFKAEDLERETYVRLLINQKALNLGIHINDEAVKVGAVGFLQSLDRTGQPVPLNNFVERVLAPEGLTVLDFQNFIRNYLTVQQIVQTYGMAGTLATPQEVGQLYDREYQEVSASAVFFSASNYLAQVSVNPSVVAQFYTNYMASYRLPDRVQVSYVSFEVSNYLAQARAEWAKTNFDAEIDAAYRQYAAEFAGEKVEDAKAKIKDTLIKQRAAADASAQAKEFAAVAFAMEPVKAENLAVAAKQKGLTIQTTAPFAAQYGPSEFAGSAAFVKAAFKLSPDEPLAGPVAGQDSIYIIGLVQQLPSAIPPLDQIRGRVTQDCELQQAVALAQRAGTNFYAVAAAQLAAGKKFTQAAVAAGFAPMILAPFSLSSTTIPEVSDRADLNQFKQVAFGTAPGQLSKFYPSGDGGFVLFVDALVPVDQAKKTAELAQFGNQVRRGRQNEAFNLWLSAEASRELANTPFAKQLANKMPK